MDLTHYVGKPANSLLNSEPFSNWRVDGTVEHGLGEPIVQCAFMRHGGNLDVGRRAYSSQ